MKRINYLILTFICAFVALITTNASVYGGNYVTPNNSKHVIGDVVCEYEKYNELKVRNTDEYRGLNSDELWSFAFITREVVSGNNHPYSYVYHFYIYNNKNKNIFHAGFIDGNQNYFTAQYIYLNDHDKITIGNRYVHSKWFDEEQTELNGNSTLISVYHSLNNGNCPGSVYGNPIKDVLKDYKGLDANPGTMIRIFNTKSSEYGKLKKNTSTTSSVQYKKEITSVDKDYCKTNNCKIEEQGSPKCNYVEVPGKRSSKFASNFTLNPSIYVDSKNTYRLYYKFNDPYYTIYNGQTKKSSGTIISKATLTWNPSSSFADGMSFGMTTSTKSNTKAYDEALLNELTQNGNCPSYMLYDASNLDKREEGIGGYFRFTNDSSVYDSTKKQILFANGGSGNGTGGTTLDDGITRIVSHDRDPFRGITSMNKWTLSAASTNTEYVTVEVDCPDFDFCQQYGVLKTFEITHKIISIAKIVVPILIIIIGSIDFAKATISNDADAIEKTTQIFIKRFILAAVIFFVPTFVNAMLGILNINSDPDNKFTSCTSCFTGDSKCTSLLAKAKQTQDTGICTEQVAREREADSTNKDYRNIICKYHTDPGIGTFFVSDSGGDYYLQRLMPNGEVKDYISPSGLYVFFTMDVGGTHYTSAYDEEGYRAFKEHVQNSGCFQNITRGTENEYSFYASDEVQSVTGNNEDQNVVLECTSDCTVEGLK